MLVSSAWFSHSADLKIPQMKTFSLLSNPLKAAFAGLLLSGTLINAGDVKAVPCLLNSLGTCPAYNDGTFKVDSFTITPTSGWNGPSLFFNDFLNVTNSGGPNPVLSIDVSLNPGRSLPVGATLMYNVMKLGGNPFVQASSNGTVGNVPPIGSGTATITSGILGLNGGSLVSMNGIMDSDLFTTPLTSTKVTSVFGTTGPGTISSFKVEFTSGTPISTTIVPGPLPILGAGAAFGFSRRLRRRIKTSATA